MTRIYLIRHAEAEGNLYRRVQGQYNSLVTDRGFRQIAALRDRFAKEPIDAVFSSDLYRTMVTARAVYPSHSLPLITVPGLREISVGEWEDLPWGLLAQKQQNQLHLFDVNSPDWSVPGGETFAAVRRRLTRTLARLARDHEGETLAVFSHGMVIRNALASLQGLSVAEGAAVPHCDNTGVSLLEYRDGTAKVVYQNDNSHLPQSLSTFAEQKWWKHKDGALADANLWYCPLKLDGQGERFYLTCREEAWRGLYGDLQGFDGPGFWSEGKTRLLFQVMLREEPVGLLELEPGTGRAGNIPFLYLLPDFRRQGLGVQLIGQAVSVFRRQGKDALRLLCSPENVSAQGFYQKYGFVKLGAGTGSRGPLDVLEKYIGFER